MARLVRVQLGEWIKAPTGEWDFVRDDTDLGYGVMIRDDESFETLMEMVKKRYLFEERTPVVLTYRFPEWMLVPDGNKTPPMNVLTTGDVGIMMNSRMWYPELTLCVTGGSEAVAKYHFHCRSPFSVGGTTFEVGGTQDASLGPSFAALISGGLIIASQAAMEEIFTDEEMLVIHRVHLEMNNDTNDEASSDGNAPPQQAEIVENLVDEQHVTTEPAMSELGTVNGDQVVPEANVTPSVADLNSPPLTEIFHMYGDNGFILLGSDPVVGGVDDAMGFWNGLAADQFTPDGYAEPMDVNATYQAGITMDGLPVPELALSDIGPVEEDGSSTGSSSAVNSPTGVCDDVEMFEEPRPVGDDAPRPPSTDTALIAQPANRDVIPGAGVSIPPASGSENAPSLRLTLGPCTTNYAMAAAPVAVSSSSGESEEAGEYVNNNPTQLFVGMVFKNREAFKLHVALYAIDNKFRYRSPRSTPEGMVVQCSGLACPWRVYAARVTGAEIFEIRKLNLIHRCTVDDRTGYERQATTNVIGEVLKPRYAGQSGGPRPNDIMEMMQGDHDVSISYWKAWRSREIAMDYARGSSGDSYKSLPTYLKNLVLANPGTLVALHTETDEKVGNRFKYLFFAMNASIEGYKYMRKVVVVDGTHLKGKYAGCLLTASAQDGNYQIFPLAFAIVDGETDKAWEWFFRNLSEFVPNEEVLVFVSDRHASIYHGLSKVYPSAGHCACVVHLKRNIRSYFKNRHLGYIVARAARSYRIADFYTHFQEIRIMDPTCADYLIGIGLSHWSRSHFRGNRYNIMSSNIAESWNAVLRDAREYPIVALVEFIRSKLMSWFCNRRNVANRGSDTISPRVMEHLAINFEKAGGFNIQRMNSYEFEVQDKDGKTFHVDLADKSCSCFEFQMLKIPCTHAVAAAVKGKMRIDELVAKEYSTDSLTAAYEGRIYPVIEANDEPDLTNAIDALSLYPPLTRRPPGRPRKKRFLSRGEFTKKKTMRKRTVCSRCNQMGHNRATCKMPI